MKFLFTAASLSLMLAHNSVALAQVSPVPAPWRAAITLTGGIPKTCGDEPYSKYNMKVDGKWLIGDPVNGASNGVNPIRLDIGSLKADGTGEISFKSRINGIPWTFRFMPRPSGQPLIFDVINGNDGCIRRFTPG